MNALVALMLLTAPADEDFDAHLADAQAAFKEERFDEAAGALEAAYAISPEDDVLFNWANAERLSGDCARAIELYDRYLGAVAEDVAEGDAVSGRYAEIAQQRRTECAEQEAAAPLAAQPEPEPVPAPAQADLRDRDPRPLPATDEPPRRDWTKDALGWSLVGVGTAAAAVGGGLLGAAFVGTPDPAERDTHDDYLSDVRRGSRMELGGWSMVGVGSALLIGGVVRLVVVARRSKRAETASIAPLVVRF